MALQPDAGCHAPARVMGCCAIRMGRGLWVLRCHWVCSILARDPVSTLPPVCAPSALLPQRPATRVRPQRPAFAPVTHAAMLHRHASPRQARLRCQYKLKNGAPSQKVLRSLCFLIPQPPPLPNNFERKSLLLHLIGCAIQQINGKINVHFDDCLLL